MCTHFQIHLYISQFFSSYIVILANDQFMKFQVGTIFFILNPHCFLILFYPILFFHFFIINNFCKMFYCQKIHHNFYNYDNYYTFYRFFHSTNPLFNLRNRIFLLEIKNSRKNYANLLSQFSQILLNEIFLNCQYPINKSRSFLCFP